MPESDWLQRRMLKITGQVERYNAYMRGETIPPRLRTALLTWAEGRTATDDDERALLELAAELRENG